MEKHSPDDAEPDALGDESHRHRLSDALGTTDLALNRYRIAPGEGFPSGLHAHADQEEVFVVVEGEATFETLARRDDGAVANEGREITVGPGEAIRFSPGEFQSGRNDADGDLVAFALGAPRESDDVRIPVTCPECGNGEMRLDAGGDGPTFVCPDCSAERVPGGCPDCGSEMYVALGATSRPVVVCDSCGVELEAAPFVEEA
ncbi:cupin domain-containing protein [Halorussus amylolyticus]|uniref:cupin domain-containing protein n=1 Tax=Halorussus amylolyticus TaxID=1126242 RepID=UPI0010428577|nr:cupin domain-containing protein [Halorussus amylolyticus]